MRLSFCLLLSVFELCEYFLRHSDTSDDMHIAASVCCCEHDVRTKFSSGGFPMPHHHSFMFGFVLLFVV